MAGSVVATAWVEIVPEMKGSQGKITEILTEEGSKAGTKGGQKAGDGFSKGFSAKAGAIAGVVSAVASKALDAVANLTSEMIESSDSAQKFASTLSFAGLDTSVIDELTVSTQKYADETIYGLSDIRSITSQLASNGVANYDKLAEAAGNLNAVAGGTADTYKTVGLVLTQTNGLGKLNAENWNQLAEAIPGASGKIKDELLNMGAYTGNFQEAMSDGEISAEEFNQALLNLGFSDVAVEAATSASTIEGACGNLEAAAVSVGQAFIDGVKPMVTGAMSAGAEALAGLATGVTDFFDACANNGSAEVATSIIQTLGDTAGAIGNIFKIAVGGLLGWDSQTSASASAADVLKGALDAVKPVVEGLNGAFQYLADNPMVVNALVGVAGGALAINKAKGAISVLSGIAGNVNNIAGEGAEAAAGLVSTAAGEAAAGTAATASTGQILACAVAVVALGAGVLMVSTGLWLLANAAVSIAASGPVAAAVLLGMVGAVAGLAIGAAALAPALTAGAVGFVAFGIAILAVGTGITVASAGLALLATQLPTIAAYGLGASVALAAIGVSSIVAGAGLLVVGAGAIVAGAGALVLAAGLTVASAAVVVASAAIVVASAAVTLFSGAVTVLAAAVGLLGAGLTTCGASLLQMGVGCIQIAANGTLAAANLTALGVAGLAASAALLACGPAATTASAGILTVTPALVALNAALLLSTTSVRTFSSSAKSSFDTFKSSAKTSADQAKQAITSACNSMSSQVSSMRLTLPRISVGALPHFYMRGTFNAQTGSVPSVGVNWYAQGGLFGANTPTIIGVGDNTRYKEVAMPLSPDVLSGIGEGISNEMGGSSDNSAIQELIDAFRNSEFALYLDKKKVASTMAGPMNVALATVSSRGAR